MKIETVTSALRMNDLYVQQSSFERNSRHVTNGELEISVKRHKKMCDDHAYQITLDFSLSNALNEFTLGITIVGIFEVDQTADAIKDELLEKNTLAIMFPFARAQITILSSQPGMSPIVLPPININSLFDESSKNEVE